ncbi:Uncharacterized protein Rs2_09323 [Raphanus sativus]|nr:Uncharacterized protein Rs2_09323 [Raphanus sativus]
MEWFFFQDVSGFRFALVGFNPIYWNTEIPISAHMGPRESKYTFLQESDDQIQASSAKEFNNIVGIKLRPMKLLLGALVGLCCLSLMPSCLIVFWLAGGAETLLTPHIKDYSSLVFSQLQELSSVNVHLVGPDGCIVGFVAGMLVARSQVQVIVGSFVSEKLKLSTRRVENNLSQVQLHHLYWWEERW